ncbi:MAG: OPT oligopeptide transporter protein-domain-containing protein [Olpidium bornovanus]|uniref:OPT oligopeptide transporter protein-domain-containing protein n=1 Tax=Olpidium bornovanus TaxID=278681 RepID=A0A8H7ZW33_9FUNG|nr:MAG: OPT oligopeptide transporter protein-domain-containing protein [Olpidium bornovanus]
MNIAAVIAHCFLWHGSTIVKETKAMLRGAGRGGDDIHNQLMRAYPEVSEYVYLGLLMVFTVIMCLVGTFTPFTLPIWAVLLAVAIAAVFMLPTGIIIAITGQGIYLNVFTEFIIGLIIPGQTGTEVHRPCQMRPLSYAETKLMLITQLYGTTVGAIISTVVCYNIIVDEDWLKDLNNEDSAWNGINFRIFTNAGAIWGAIGPARFFSGHYTKLFYSFLIGPLLCLIPYFGNKMRPSRLWKYCNIPLLTMPLGGAGMPQNMIVMSFVTAFVFQYWLFRHRYDWYSKYNYVLAAALDTGTAIAVLVTSQLAGYIVPPIWSGNPLAVTPDYYCYTPGRMCAGKAYCSKFNDP